MSFFLQEKHVTNSQYSEQAIKGEDGQKFRVPSLGTRERKTSSLARFRTTVSAVVNAEGINTRRHGTSQPGSTYGEHFQIFQVSLTWTNSTFLLQSIFYRKLPISRAPIFRSLNCNSQRSLTLSIQLALMSRWNLKQIFGKETHQPLYVA